MSRLTLDGTAEPISRDQNLRHERGQGNIHFPCSADHKQDWQSCPVDPYSCYMCDHIYIHTDQPGMTVNPARGQLNRENDVFPCPRSRLRIWSRESLSVLPSRVSPLILCTQAESSIINHQSSIINLVLTHGIPYYAFRDGVHII